MHTSIFNLIGLCNSMRFLNVAPSLKLTIKYGNERFAHLENDSKCNRFIQNLLQSDHQIGNKQLIYLVNAYIEPGYQGQY